jgi:hypothetical protein
MNDELANAIVAELAKGSMVANSIAILQPDGGYKYLQTQDLQAFAKWIQAKDARMVRLAAKVADAL